MRPADPRDPFSTPPAPVFTGNEDYPVPPRRAAPPPPARPSGARRATFALALVSGLWLLTLAASQATSPPVAIPFLERTIGALGDVPALLHLHERAIRNTATEGGGDQPVAVPGFPVPGATLPRPLARSGSLEEWRATLLRASAEAMYERGAAVFTVEGTPTDSGTFSTSAWVRLVLRLMSAETHRAANLAAWGLGLGALALGALAFVLTDGARRFVALGLGLIGGAVLGAVAGIFGLGVVLILSVGGSSPFVSEVAALARGVAWTPLYGAAWLAIAGFAIALPGAVAAAWLARSEDDADDFA